MSTAALRRFLPALRKVEGELRVPLPARVRILHELEYDLEELRDRLAAEGLTPEEAEARALEALVPDPIALRELGRLHTPLYGRLTRGMADHRLRLAERSALALTAAFVLLVETFALMRADLLADPSPFLWPVLGLGALLAAAIVWTGFELWVKGDHRVPDRRLDAVVTLSLVLPVVAVGGAFIDFCSLAATLEVTPERALLLVPAWLVRDGALLAVAVLFGTAGAWTWFVLTRWLATVREAHREALGLDDRFPETRRVGHG